MFKCIYYQVILAGFHIFDFHFYKSDFYCIFILMTCYDESGKDIEVKKKQSVYVCWICFCFYASLNMYEYICIYLKNTRIMGRIGFALATNYICLCVRHGLTVLIYVTHLVAINDVIVLNRVDFGHGERHGKPNYGCRKGLHCTLLEDFQIRGNGRLVPKV